MICTHVSQGPEDAKRGKNKQNKYGLQKVGKSYFTQEPLLDRLMKNSWQQGICRTMVRRKAWEAYSNFNLNPPSIK